MAWIPGPDDIDCGHEDRHYRPRQWADELARADAIAAGHPSAEAFVRRSIDAMLADLQGAPIAARRPWLYRAIDSLLNRKRVTR